MLISFVIWRILEGMARLAASQMTSLHRRLASANQHRPFRLPDLIIAATAECGGAMVLHYDDAYDRVAGVTGQATG